MLTDVETKRWTQIASVQGGIGECGDDEYPGIYVRLDNAPVYDFLDNVLNNSTFVESFPKETITKKDFSSKGKFEIGIKSFNSRYYNTIKSYVLWPSSKVSNLSTKCAKILVKNVEWIVVAL